jgi:hypothetical protein
MRVERTATEEPLTGSVGYKQYIIIIISVF